MASSDADHWSLRPSGFAADSRDAAGQTRLMRSFAPSSPRRASRPPPPADRRTLIRRLTFDLHGLPPTPEEIDAFVDDPAPDAYERLVDRLLASPRYGERWARHWMDVVHFAETHGHDQDAVRENAWPYRDYLIRSFNADKPYARFVQEQIAGDVLFPDDPQAIAALGFLAAGPWDESSQRDIRDDTIDKKQAQYLDRDDMVTTVFTADRQHDGPLRPLPRSQVRSDSADGVLRPASGVRRRRSRESAVRRRPRSLPKPGVSCWRSKADMLAGKFDLAKQRSCSRSVGKRHQPAA